MLSPKRTKFRKAHKGRVHGNAKGGTSLNFGTYGLKALQPGRITARQIEASRRAVTRHIKRAGKVWIRIFPDVPVTAIIVSGWRPKKRPATSAKRWRGSSSSITGTSLGVCKEFLS